MQEALIKVGMVIGALLLSVAYSYYHPNAKPDNRVEEISEQIIKQQTGIDVDLTPDTSE